MKRTVQASDIRSRRVSALAAVVLTSATVPALAQQAAPDQLEEVVVTAQKRSENIQQVPIAITAFTAETLKNKGINDIQMLGNSTPGVNFDASSPFSGSFLVLSASIRGIGQDDFAMNLDPGVGVYVDGVYFARTVGANQNLLDVERVEVLKGPQGTLFGRNTIGGAISIVTRAPGDEFSAEAQMTTGRFNRRDFAGTVDIPITSTLLSSISFSSNQRDGYQQRIPDPNLPGNFVPSFPGNYDLPQHYAEYDTAGGQNNQTVRAKLLWKASDDVSVTIGGDWTHSDTSATPNTVISVDNDPTALASLYNGCASGAPIPICSFPMGPPTPGTTNFTRPAFNATPRELFTFANTQTGNIDTTYAGGPNFDYLESGGASATIDWTLSGHLALKSITAYRRLLWDSGLNTSGIGGVFSTGFFEESQHQVSQEFQLIGDAFDNRLNYVAGLYYFNEDGYIHDFPILGGGLVQIDGDNLIDTKSYAGFVHADYRVTNQFGVTLGGRYSLEHKELEGSQGDENAIIYKTAPSPFAPCFPITPACVTALGFPSQSEPLRYFPPGENSQNFNLFTPDIGAQYHFSDTLMTYVSWSKGFKSGGWTTRLTSPLLNADDAKFGPETDKALEFGLKSDWLDHRLTLDWAGYYTQYDGIQLNFVQGNGAYIKNAGDAKILGSELEGRAILGHGLSLNANLAYTDAYYTRLAPGTAQDSTATDPVALPLTTQLPKTPKWKLNFSPQYDANLPNTAILRFMFDWTHTTQLYNNAVNTPELRRPTLDLLNASVTYLSPDDQYELTVGGTNLTDKRYIVSGTDNSGPGGLGYIFGTYNAPAEWFLTLRWNLQPGKKKE